MSSIQDGTPPRHEAKGGCNSFFESCVVDGGYLEAGRVVEKLWAKHHYGLGYIYAEGKGASYAFEE